MNGNWNFTSYLCLQVYFIHEIGWVNKPSNRKCKDEERDSQSCKSKDKYESGWVKKCNESFDERSKDEEWELTEL